MKCIKKRPYWGGEGEESMIIYAFPFELQVSKVIIFVLCFCIFQSTFKTTLICEGKMQENPKIELRLKKARNLEKSAITEDEKGLLVKKNF